jgi:hypothetical protein
VRKSIRVDRIDRVLFELLSKATRRLCLTEREALT